MRVEKLAGSLITYKMKLKPNNNDKGVALKAEANDEIESLEGGLTNEIVEMITQIFQHYMNEYLERNGGEKQGMHNSNKRNQKTKGKSNKKKLMVGKQKRWFDEMNSRDLVTYFLIVPIHKTKIENILKLWQLHRVMKQML